MEGRTEVPEQFFGSEPKVTDKQLPFLRSLATERDIPDEARAELLLRLDRDSELPRDERGMTMKQASDFIGRLLEKPKLDSQPVAGHWVPFVTKSTVDGEPMYGMARDEQEEEVPAGRYAILTADLPWNVGIVNETNFYRVYVWQPDDKPEGELAWTVKQQVSDDMVKIPRARQYDALKVIAGDVDAALTRYGKEFERCGVCGRGLTNDASRERGIGPVCASRWGL